MHTKSLRRTASVFAASLIAVAAWGAMPAAAQSGSASVRVAHFSPDAPNVDVYVDGSAALTGVAFKDVSDVLTLPAGSHDVAVRPAGAAADSAAVIDTTVNLEAAASYTIAAVGLLDSIQAQVWEGAATSPPEGMAGVRAIHAAPEVGAVDVATSDGTVVLSNLSFPNASEYLMLPAGEYALDVRATGTTDALLMTTANVESGKLYSVVAIGGGDAAPELIAIVDAAGSDTPAVLGTATGEGGTSAATGAMWAIIAAFVVTGGAIIMRSRRTVTASR